MRSVYAGGNRKIFKVHNPLSFVLASILTFTGLWPFVPLPIALGQTTQACALPGKDGPLPGPGVINTYYSGNTSVAAGATSISLDAATGSSTPIALGDLLLLIQMQGADLNSTNTGAYGDGVAGDPASGQLSTNFTAGLYEYVVATSAVSTAGGTVSIRSGPTGGGVINSYTNANNTGGTSQGQRRFQVIRVPQYSSATLTSGLTATRWNGKAGGVLVFDVAGQMNLGGATVSLDGLGFQGGAGRQLNGAGSTTDYRTLSTGNSNASKGEGIAGTPRYTFNAATSALVDNTNEGYPLGSYARGAPGNAGGGGTVVDSGGGGGGNGGLGGRGGNTWNTNLAVGGFGGATFSNAANRLVLGGGGGAGISNNGGLSSSGGAGGGIVMVRAGSVSGTGTISANGSNGFTPLNDGGGGAGAGGSVLVVAASGNLTGLSVRARGGRGGDSWPTQAPGGNPGERHGPGGGGGGGFVALSSAAGSPPDVSGGANGTTTTANDAYGATSGVTGQSVTAVTSDQTPGIDPGTECGPVLTPTKVTSPTVGPVSINNTPSGTTATYSITVSNAALRSTATNVAISDPLPSGFSYASTGTILLNGGATRSAPSNPTVGATTPIWGTFAIPAGGSVSIPFTVNIAASVPSGTYQNPATATYLDPTRTVVTGTTSASYNAASSTGEDVTINNSPPRLRLVKRVTAMQRSSVNVLPLTYIDIGTGTGDGDDNALGWPNTPAPVIATIDSGPATNASFSPFLQGAISRNDARPNDEVEYTIYFLSDGGRTAGNVKLCDFVPANSTYVPNSFQLSSNGILTNLTDAADGIDAGKFVPDPGPFDAACAGTNNSKGAVFLNIGTVNSSTGPGTPATSYGFIRFRARVN
jgi:uncharacterized repeat protein (TIGR01451 family)